MILLHYILNVLFNVEFSEIFNFFLFNVGGQHNVIFNLSGQH
jgi:hypothetical protein